MGEGANRCLFCAPFRYNRHIPKTAAAAIITGPTPECMIVSPRGLEHSSRKGDEEEEGDDIGDKAKGCLSSGGRKTRAERGGCECDMIPETGPDHDFGFGAVQGERASFDRSYGMSAAVRSPARVHHCERRRRRSASGGRARRPTILAISNWRNRSEAD